jgi:hypothetical protein
LTAIPFFPFSAHFSFFQLFHFGLSPVNGSQGFERDSDKTNPDSGIAGIKNARHKVRAG